MNHQPQSRFTIDLFLDPLVDCLTPEVARRISELEPISPTPARLEILREGANEGTLSDAERDEYEAFVEALDWMAILRLKIKARWLR